MNHRATTKTVNLLLSNEIIRRTIEKYNTGGDPFIISRIGSAEGYVSAIYLSRKKLEMGYTKVLENNAGIYNCDKNRLKTYCEKYNRCIENSRYMACFDKLCADLQNYYLKRFKITAIHSRSLEPFYAVLEGDKPWTHALRGKKVLIINPFVDSMQKQLDAGFQIFKHEKLFCEGQEFVFYKCYQTSCGNNVHDNWLKTFHIMCQDIEKLDFDIALLGCGGYGLPLCDFIKTKLNKSAIYIGGGLQLMFGVMGKRWENNEMWKKIIRENNCQFIRPSGDEIIGGKNKVEGGCYW